jgi:hypothetical protein
MKEIKFRVHNFTPIPITSATMLVTRLPTDRLVSRAVGVSFRLVSWGYSSCTMVRRNPDRVCNL